MHSEEIDRIADDFERARRSGRNPNIDDYLPREPESRKRVLAELVAIEVEMRQDDGEHVTIEQYHQRFPGDVSILEEVFKYDAPECDLGDQETEYELSLPEKLGRYDVIQRLGQGAFGTVLLGRDTELGRLVALKVPRDKLRFESSGQLDRFIQEARNAASLQHPGIVTVYDAQVEGGTPIIVQEYIDGQELGAWAEQNSPSHRDLALIFIQICEAIAYAHQRKLYHCDLKLGNVLMDCENRVHVADFGLAVHEEAADQRRGAIVGTPSVMAPEQVRGEGHRVEGRTDIWAIGVMMYELLAGRKPFIAASRKELFDQILSLDPKPPRQIDRTIPRELERICLQCLARRKTERYSSAESLLDDLRRWVFTLGSAADGTFTPSATYDANSSPTSMRKPSSAFIPRGLRSYEDEDAQFFLDLLPGPRDSEGFPASVRLWKRRIEADDYDRTFSVGLICGPSGSGKSSLVKAGIIPHLSPDIAAIFVEATPADLESRILDRLKRRIPNLAREESLSDACAMLRVHGASDARKVVLIIDQFEQWLFAKRSKGALTLIDALRQCDGLHLQTLLLVRDDFHHSVARMFHELEIHLREDRNYSIIDLFDLDHAKKVLTKLGQAYDKIGEEPNSEQKAFIERAIEDLADGERVICMRIALLAEMLKLRPWTRETLRQVGGIKGIGTAFLEEVFASNASSPVSRLYRKQARQCLAAMLPEYGTDIKQKRISVTQLARISGLEHESLQFNGLISLLRDELKLISEVDPDPNQRRPARLFQLTHDYLVPAIRHWIWDQRTLSGKANQRLSELSARWRSDRQRRNLPNLWEFATIAFFSTRATWSKTQRQMMAVARRSHLARLGLTTVIALAVLSAGSFWMSHQRHKNEIEKVRLAVDNLQFADALRRLKELDSDLVRHELRNRFKPDDYSESNLRVAVALTQNGYFETATYLITAIAEASDGDLPLLIETLTQIPNIDIGRIKGESMRVAYRELRDWHIKSRFAIALLHLGDLTLARQMMQEEPEDPVARREFIYAFQQYPGRVDSLADHLRAANGSTNANLRYGICLALGGRKPDKETIQSWQPVLERWYLEEPDSGTHSAASYALRKWRLDPPEDLSPATPFLNRRWARTPFGLTLILLKPGKVESETSVITVEKQFALSDREITEQQMLACTEDANYLGPKPTDWAAKNLNRGPTYPATNVTYSDAVMFCNWLSSLEGVEKCYDQHEGSWKFTDRGGYRLPFDYEWEFACRANTNSAYSFGNASVHMEQYDYAVCEENSGGKPWPTGTTKCNPWGFFDMHGNASEHCEFENLNFSRPISKPDSPELLVQLVKEYGTVLGKIVARGSTSYLTRGGDYRSDKYRCTSFAAWLIEDESRWDVTGFRVARTLDSTDVDSGTSLDH